MATGLKQVRKELGPDALILSTRTVKDGKMGLLGKKYLEITAAIDQHIDNDLKPELPKQPLSAAVTAYQKNSEPQLQSEADEKREDAKPKQDDSSDEDLTFTLTPRKTAPQESENKLPEEFYELQNMVKSLAGEVSKMSSTENQASESSSLPMLGKLEQKLLAGNKNSAIEKILLKHGVNEVTAGILSAYCNEQYKDRNIQQEGEIYTLLHEALAELLTTKDIGLSNGDGQRRIALVGPTGVGKTTTLAKIAAQCLTETTSSIALITIDTYRIAAVEQLKVYGEIMHLPVEIVLTPQEMKKALDKHTDKDVILIDTAGRSPRDILSIEEISTFISDSSQVACHLVVSATTRDDELLEIIQRFGPLNPESIIFTKIDECSNLGVLLNTQTGNSTPVSFVTNGQRVPEDIIEADNLKLAQLILPPPNGTIHE